MNFQKTALLLCSLWMLITFTGCVSVRTPISLEEKEKIESVNTTVFVEQDEIFAEINPSTAGAQFGLIGAIVDVSINQANAKRAEKAIVDVKDGMIDYDFRGRFQELLEERHFSENEWLVDSDVEIGTIVTEVSEESLAELSDSEALLGIVCSYSLKPGMSGIRVFARVQLSVKENDKSYYNHFTYHNNGIVVSELEEDYSLIMDGLDQGISNILDLLDYDISIVEGEELEDVSSENVPLLGNCKLVRVNEGSSRWYRMNDGSLAAVAEVSSE